MSDLINRQDVLKLIENTPYDWSNITERTEMLRKINALPSADVPDTNVGKWTPCSEGLPKKAGTYLCTVVAPYRNPREMRYAPQEWADEIDNATWRDTDGYYVFDWFVEAWMPLPEPWKGADDEEST